MTSVVPPKKLAYLCSEYPSVSHTFVRREILELERLGYVVTRIGVRHGSVTVDSRDEDEISRTYSLVGIPPIKLLQRIAHGGGLAGWKIFTGLATTLRLSRASDRGLLRHIAYFVEGLALLSITRSTGTEHLHVHFGNNAAAVALIAHTMGGCSYSMTVHGPDEFDSPIAFSLGWKMTEALFTVAITSYCSAQLRRWVSYDEWRKISIVHCTVDQRWFEAASPVEESADSVVCVGRLCANKGQLLLLDAFRDAVLQGFSLKLVLIGDGDLGPELHSRAREYGIEDRVEFAGWCDESTIREKLLRSRCMVLPSFAEGLPVVIMESMALERPVITTWITGVPELVTERTGWLVTPGDTQVLCEALLALECTPVEKLREMGRHAKKQVLEHHSSNLEAIKLDTLFRRYVHSA